MTTTMAEGTKDRRHWPGWLRRLGQALAASVLLLMVAVGYGTPAGDAARMVAFADAVERWQTGPDFRVVQGEYVRLGVDATRTRLMFLPTGPTVVWLRSLPGLPEHLRVAETSSAHYAAFAGGELSAYLYLCDEQGLAWVLEVLERLGPEPQVTDEQLRGFLNGFRLHYPVSVDDAAVAGVRALIRDIDTTRPFVVRDAVTDRLRPHIAALAAVLPAPPDVREMTPAQQSDVFGQLDAYVRLHDPELWRTKQVNDLLSGIWAQVYGRVYRENLLPVLAVRRVCRAGAPVLLGAWVVWAMVRRRQSFATPDAPPLSSAAQERGAAA